MSREEECQKVLCSASLWKKKRQHCKYCTHHWEISWTKFSRNSAALVSISGFVIFIPTLPRLTSLYSNSFTMQYFAETLIKFPVQNRAQAVNQFYARHQWVKISNAALFLLLAHISTRSSSMCLRCLCLDILHESLKKKRIFCIMYQIKCSCLECCGSSMFNRNFKCMSTRNSHYKGSTNFY